MKFRRIINLFRGKPGGDQECEFIFVARGANGAEAEINSPLFEHARRVEEIASQGETIETLETIMRGMAPQWNEILSSLDCPDSVTLTLCLEDNAMQIEYQVRVGPSSYKRRSALNEVPCLADWITTLPHTQWKLLKQMDLARRFLNHSSRHTHAEHESLVRLHSEELELQDFLAQCGPD